MPDTPTTRFGIAQPKSDRSDTADVPRDVRAIVAALEAQGARVGHGLLADRPAFGKSLSFYIATDQTPPQLSYDKGDAWVTLGSIAAGAVGTLQLADGAVTTIKIADLNVTNAKIADRTIAAIKIVAGAITSAEIASALKPSGGASGGTEALRALGTGAGQAAPGIHASQHGAAGADPLTITQAMLDPTVAALLPQPGDKKDVFYDVQAGVNEPAGWLLCDGRSLLRTDYPNLFNKISTTWGNVDGTHFNLPDTRGRSAVGKGQGPGMTLRNVGQVFGEETHQLSSGEMPVHSHAVSDPGHGHSVNDPGHLHAVINRALNSNGVGFASGSFFVNQIQVNSGSSSITTTQTTNISINGNTTGVSIQNAGGGTAHNNMQPCYVVSVLIKT
jgi:microcystin-dependent protein